MSRVVLLCVPNHLKRFNIKNLCDGGSFVYNLVRLIGHTGK